MSISNFEKVKHFNLSFGVKLHDTPQPNIFNSEPDSVQMSLKLIDEEVGELHQAVNEKDYKEVCDALADILYVVYGMGARMGLDMDKALDLVHKNNMSKLCYNIEEAEATVKHYLEHPELGYTSPTIRKSFDKTRLVVYNKDSKKVLKSINWKPVDLTECITPNAEKLPWHDKDC